MSFSLQPSMTPGLTMQPTPIMVAFAELLALPCMELRQRVVTELDSNPALESEEPAGCELCGSYECADSCKGSPPSLGRTGLDTSPGLDAYAHEAGERCNLLREARLLLESADIPIAEYLIGSLDDRGFLDSAPEGIAASLGVDEKRVRRVLGLVREVGPPGLGACDITECLLLQLDTVDGEQESHRLARLIIGNHLRDLALGRFGRIARALGATTDEVMAVRRFIRASLRPYPGCQPTESAQYTPSPAPPAVVPDVIVKPRGGQSGGYDATLAEPLGFGLRISPLYLSLAGGASHQADQRVAPRDTVRHARLHVRRAESFLSLLEQRKRTLQRIAQYILDEQKGFLQDGSRALRPLTRAGVASALGLHESTVSRATAGKYARLPSGNVIPFANFFQATLGVEEALKLITASESRPMTDEQLRVKLQAVGYSVARRTVTKYRSRMGIPAGSLR